MNLFQVRQEIEDAIFAATDPETGELGDLSAIQALQLEREELIENLALKHKNLASDFRDLDTEEKEFHKRKEAVKKQMEKIDQILYDELNGSPFKTARCRVSFRPSTETVIDPDKKQELLDWVNYNGYEGITKQGEITFDKTKLKKLLEANIPIPGVTLVQHNNMGVK